MHIYLYMYVSCLSCGKVTVVQERVLQSFLLLAGGYMVQPRSRESKESEDDATQAFLILAFLAYLISFILILLINFAELSNKLFKIITIIACFVGGSHPLQSNIDDVTPLTSLR